MYQNNKVFGDAGSLSFHTSFTKVCGGFITISATHNSSPGNQTKMISGRFSYAWRDASGNTIAAPPPEDFGMGTTNEFNQVTFGGTNIEPQANARLWVFCDVYVTNPDGSQNTTYYWQVATSIYFYTAPGQVGINSPENEPVPAGGSMDAYCGWDFNGSNTRYQAELARPDGSNVQTTGEQGSNHFVVSVGSSVDSNGQCKWRARAINDQGVGAWSDWCQFSCSSPINGDVSCSVNALPTKPTHAVDASFNCSSGHTITDYQWTLYKLENGNWVQLASGSGNPISFASLQNDPNGIDYRINALVTGTKWGVQSQFSTAGYCSYIGLS